MPIQLTTPLNPGAFDTGVYDHVRVGTFRHDSNRSMILLDIEYGTLSGQDWVRASLTPSQGSTYPTSDIIQGQDYIDIALNHMSLDGERTYDAVKRGMYDYLQGKYPALAGTQL